MLKNCGGWVEREECPPLQDIRRDFLQKVKKARGVKSLYNTVERSST